MFGGEYVLGVSVQGIHVRGGGGYVLEPYIYDQEARPYVMETFPHLKMGLRMP